MECAKFSYGPHPSCPWECQMILSLCSKCQKIYQIQSATLQISATVIMLMARQQTKPPHKGFKRQKGLIKVNSVVHHVLGLLPIGTKKRLIPNQSFQDDVGTVGNFHCAKLTRFVASFHFGLGLSCLFLGSVVPETQLLRSKWY